MDGHETCEAKFHAASRPASGGKVGIMYYVMSVLAMIGLSVRVPWVCGLISWSCCSCILQLYTALLAIYVPRKLPQSTFGQ